MKAWRYYHGDWCEIEDPMVWNEEEGWKTALERAGYHTFPSHTFGDFECGLGAELYVREDKPFLMVLTLADICRSIYIDDLPSLMQWLSSYAPMLSLGKIDDTLGELLILSSHAFQAWHGHDYTAICSVCDPNEWQRQVERKRQKVDKTSV